MKKIFQIIGFIILICFTFFYTERTSDVVKEMDKIMIEIRKVKDDYMVEPMNATICDNTIIPGIRGRKVDINKSYEEMSKYGVYNDTLFEFDYIKPTISVSGVYDKYIVSGNLDKKDITLLFIIDNYSNVNELVSTLEKSNIKSNIFVSSDYFNNNYNYILSLINDNTVIGNLGNNMNYDDGSFNWINTVLKNIGKQKFNYCYSEQENYDVLKKCKVEMNYTIIPNVIIKNNPLIEIKKNIKNGSIISMKISDKVLEELPLIIKYINSKGYNIVNLNDMILE